MGDVSQRRRTWAAALLSEHLLVMGGGKGLILPCAGAGTRAWLPAALASLRKPAGLSPSGKHHRKDPKFSSSCLGLLVVSQLLCWWREDAAFTGSCVFWEV